MNRCRDRQEILAIRHVTAQHGGQVQCTYCLPPTPTAQEAPGTSHIVAMPPGYCRGKRIRFHGESASAIFRVFSCLCLSLRPHRYSLRQRLALPGGSGEAFAGMLGIFPFGKRLGGRTRLAASGLVRGRKILTGGVELPSVSGLGAPGPTGAGRREPFCALCGFPASRQARRARQHLTAGMV